MRPGRMRLQMKHLTLVWILVLLSSNVLAANQNRLLQRVQSYRQANEAAVLAELRSFLSIPNVASDQANIGRNAEALVEMLRRRGLTARLLEFEGAPPAVFGELRAPGAKKTLVFYAHYDGQPVVPSEWLGDPWLPVLRDPSGKEIAFPGSGERMHPESRIYARSASDDKAPIIALLTAIDAIRAAGSRPSINVKVFFEGEEEAGSPHLRQVLETHKKLLEGDLWLLCDGPVHQTRQMQIYFGVRGVMGLEMTVFGATRALHSGHYGNWAPNPVAVMTELLAGLRASDGRILIEGFYDDVRPLSDSEKKAISVVPPVEEGLKDELAFGAAESPRSLAEAITLPALNYHGILSGHVEERATNSIPTTASVSIDFRLVPDQKPERVRELVEAHLRSRGYQIVHEQPDAATRRAHRKLVWLDWEEGYPAARTPLDLPISQSLMRAIESATAAPVVVMPTLGGSVPMYLFEEVLQASAVGVPTVNHDNNQHAANENLRLQNLWDAIEIFAAILTRMK
jgi:acetylornithine deacetylase/succinyl-diaminopimelate desuccinylase-like protein